MSTQPRDFDKAATTWDMEPRRLQLARDVAQAIAEEVPLGHDLEVLDFGCGTGLLTLLLQPLVGRITGADTSPGMLAALGEKLRALGVENVDTLLLDHQPTQPLPGSYDLIVSNMTLHHVQDVQALLLALIRALKPAGHLCLADLDQEGGQFHDDPQGVFHDGLDRAWLQGQFRAAGLERVGQRTAATVRKTARGGGLRDFTVFLISGRKPA